MARWTTSDGVELHFDERGSGRPVVLLHGWGLSGMVWEAQVAALHDSARLITLDWRGCGRSDHPAFGNTIGRIARDVVELIETLELDHPVLVGSSLGGNIALEVAVECPARVGALVLIDAPQHYFADGLDPDVFWAWHGSLRQARPEVFEQMVQGWFGPAVARATRRWTVSQLLASGWFIDGVLADAASHDRRPLLPELQLPVLLVHGRQDGEVPLAVPEAAAALLPDARLEVVEGAGHMPHLEMPSEVNALLSAFLPPCSSGHAP